MVTGNNNTLPRINNGLVSRSETVCRRDDKNWRDTSIPPNCSNLLGNICPSSQVWRPSLIIQWVRARNLVSRALKYAEMLAKSVDAPFLGAAASSARRGGEIPIRLFQMTGAIDLRNGNDSHPISVDTLESCKVDGYRDMTGADTTTTFLECVLVHTGDKSINNSFSSPKRNEFS